MAELIEQDQALPASPLACAGTCACQCNQAQEESQTRGKEASGKGWELSAYSVAIAEALTATRAASVYHYHPLDRLGGRFWLTFYRIKRWLAR
jgi:hypothetical protein